MRFWPISVVVLAAMSCPAEDTPQPPPVAAQVKTVDTKPLGPQPSVVAGAEVMVSGQYIRRGERYLGSGMAPRLFLERNFDSGFAFRGSVASFVPFRGMDPGETVIDVALGVTKPSWMKGGTMLGGYTYYNRNSNPLRAAFIGPDTQEIYAGVEFDSPAHPWAYLRYDFDKGAGRRSQPGTYLVVGASERFEVGRNVAVIVGGRVGVDFGRGVDGFSDLLLQSRLDLQLTPRLTISPGADLWLADKMQGACIVPSITLRYMTAF